MTMSAEFRKLTGFEHFFAAARYSAGGAKRAWQEAAFRHEVLAFAVLLVIYFLLAAPLETYGIAIGLFLLTIAVEALNTAIEEIVDRISPEFSTTARHAKDLGSFAVFCLLSLNGLLLGYSLWVKYLDV
ncbi:diacylglycerol kinase [Agrobacterium tumefaciens]|uniref:Diacylglycerol kinase n=2 Tax=Agrobacterium tumefaciens TaxID=358 RepID=A0AA44F5L3_AGRTU|nr:diacylglycerol kinase [Agrobacterium tumefaciens]NSL19734.1 diacylglycerol kinase [Agrobacterium tumefaciens]NTB88121.1 diacylglycerol kinase [Agrobacterium tumefaciens]NTC18356.1 diacylglycerol kinase [Agrobacterium tumefaciens]NTC29024.1 diacylglycerol kinase [Agrobacterium tumefaciens]NTC55436.1 diacylglycerol kinase [Agrobacterium tumefaciens]